MENINKTTRVATEAQGDPELLEKLKRLEEENAVLKAERIKEGRNPDIVIHGRYTSEVTCKTYKIAKGHQYIIPPRGSKFEGNKLETKRVLELANLKAPVGEDVWKSQACKEMLEHYIKIGVAFFIECND